MVQAGPLLFFGEQEHRVDLQGRISLPARFRDVFKTGIVLTRGYDRCISAYTPSQWDSYAAEVAGPSMNRVKNRRMRRIVFAAAYSLVIDRQGRVLLPSVLRNYAQIQDEVITVGMGNFLEVWAKDAWSEESVILEEDASVIAEASEERP